MAHNRHLRSTAQSTPLSVNQVCTRCRLKSAATLRCCGSITNAPADEHAEGSAHTGKQDVRGGGGLRTRSAVTPLQSLPSIVHRCSRTAVPAVTAMTPLHLLDRPNVLCCAATRAPPVTASALRLLLRTRQLRKSATEYLPDTCTAVGVVLTPRTVTLDGACETSLGRITPWHSGERRTGVALALRFSTPRATRACPRQPCHNGITHQAQLGRSGRFAPGTHLRSRCEHRTRPP